MSTKSVPNLGKQHSQGYFIWQRLKKNKGAMVGLVIICLLILVMIFADVLYDYKTEVIKNHVKERLQGPSAAHWLGTDEMGRDILARIVHGSRRSVLIGVASTTLATLIGATLGAIAGFYGDKLGELIMGFMDILLAIPATLFAIIIVAVLGASIPNLIIACCASTIPKMARILRSSVMVCRNSEYVEACRARGMKESSILIRHIIPNAIAPLFVQYTITVGATIILLSGMSFLGLGIQAPTPEWGAMLSNARTYIRDYSYMCMFPGLAIVIAILSLNLLGDGLRDALDPRLK